MLRRELYLYYHCNLPKTGVIALLEIVKAFVELPASLFALAFLGVLLRLRFRRAGQVITVGAILMLYVVSTPIVSYVLVHSLETQVAEIPVDTGPQPNAIVILSAGYQQATPEGDRQTIDALAAERLRRGAALHRATGVDILVSGGMSRHSTAALASMMAESLESDFGVMPRWIESESRSTAENADYSAAILHDAGVKKAYLVTQAWHLPRAMREFKRHGIDIVPAPTAYAMTSDSFSITRLIPSATALLGSRYAIHEYIGYLWYTLTIGSD